MRQNTESTVDSTRDLGNEGRPMRVLLVAEPGIDGVFRHIEGLVHILLSENHEIHLAYSDRRGSPALQKLVALVQERGGKCVNLGVSNAPELRDFRALWKLRKLVNRVNPQIVHGHSSKAGVLVRLLALLGARAKLYYTPQAYYGLAPRPGWNVHFYNAVERVLGRIGTTIAISKDEATFAVETLRVKPASIRTIHNPVNMTTFVPATPERKRHLQAGFGIEEGKVVLGWIGRLSFQKDPQTLYRALAPVLHEREDLVLFHAGQGEMDEELEQLAQDLGIAGKIIRRKYFDEPVAFYQACDGLIMTSRYEAGWPIVVLEAMACDLPLVVSKAPGTTDIGTAGLSHCWTAPTGQAEQFTAAIRAWLSDRGTARPCNHREIATGRFSEAQCYGEILTEYRKSLE